MNSPCDRWFCASDATSFGRYGILSRIHAATSVFTACYVYCTERETFGFHRPAGGTELSIAGREEQRHDWKIGKIREMTTKWSFLPAELTAAGYSRTVPSSGRSLGASAQTSLANDRSLLASEL